MEDQNFIKKYSRLLKKAFCISLLGFSCAHTSLYNGTTVRMITKDINNDAGIDILIEERDTNNDSQYDLELYYLIKNIKKNKLNLSNPIFISIDKDYDGELDEIIVNCSSKSTRYDLTELDSFRRVELYFLLQNLRFREFCYGAGKSYKPKIINTKIENYAVVQEWDLDGDNALDLEAMLTKSPEPNIFDAICPSSISLYKNGKVVVRFYDEDRDCIVDGEDRPDKGSY